MRYSHPSRLGALSPAFSSGDSSRIPLREPHRLPAHDPLHAVGKETLAEPEPPTHEAGRGLSAISTQAAHYAVRDLLRRLGALEIQVNLPLVPQQMAVEIITAHDARQHQQHVDAEAEHLAAERLGEPDEGVLAGAMLRHARDTAATADAGQ